MKKLGVIVNPIAGMGGRVGLKGSDGVEIMDRARELGARPEAPQRMRQALQAVSRTASGIQVITYPHEMGEDECLAAGLSPVVVGHIESGRTTPRDTREAARRIAAAGADLLMVAGGDGTARDICDAIGATVPVIGVPAGVKIHSAIYAVTPRSAGEVAAMFLAGSAMNLREAEVMDIDETAFRAGTVSARLYGYLRVPEERQRVQCAKAGGGLSEGAALNSIAADVMESMEDPACWWIIGPGTTTRAVMQALGLANTLLGVDVVRGRGLMANDVTEQQLLGLIKGGPARIVVTPIGGQGHILGRGNQQLSPRVLRQVGRANLTVIATKEKLASLGGRPFLVDTGDEDLDQALCGYVRVTTGYRDYVMYRIAVPA